MRMSLGRQSSMPKAEQKYNNIIKDKKLKTVRSVTRVSRLKASIKVDINNSQMANVQYA